VDLPLYGAALKTTLFREGDNFQVGAVASDLEEIRGLKKQAKPALILLNPEVLGAELEAGLHFLRSQNPETPILGFGEDKSKAEPLGLEAYISKPATIFELNPWRGPGLELLETIHQRFGLARKIKVMLVDDAALMLNILHRILESDKRIEIIAQVSNGQEALIQLQYHQPDVILLDIEMPIMDGLSFLKHARIKSRSKIIILSSVSMAGSNKAAEARRLGADAVITKPSGAISLDLEELSGHQIIETIYQVLRQ